MPFDTRTESSVLADLEIPRIINGMGWITTVGGSIMRPPTVRAMAEAANCYVDIHALNISAGKIIARFTGAEAGLVVAGAGAGLLLQAAACMTRSDSQLMDRLPQTEGMKNEILLYSNHQTGYARCYRAAGANLKIWSEGDRDPRIVLRESIGLRTAAVAYLFHQWNHCPILLAEVVEIAHDAGVPVIVDAAVMLPPVDSLTRFIDDGADLVTFSGGKGLRGPQSTGILCGRADLIEAARLNMSPNHGIGRPAKVCKEEIVGLVAALQQFVKVDHEAEWAEWLSMTESIVDGLGDIPGVDIRIEDRDPDRQGPNAVVYFNDDWDGAKSRTILERL
ncbi:MAG: aminotransferase class V-fold PLP-dependent enzyme, partial [Chloroflexota bacterium]|nr:aminotransferase class V-fold PLP-dependent enzyme [Chloroflexota bacterium]